MQKFKLGPGCCFLFTPSLSHNHLSEPGRQVLSFITSFFSLASNRAHSSASQVAPKNSIVVDYLIDSLKFSQTGAIAISSRFQYVKSLEKSKAVVCFFKALGCSDAQIQSSAHSAPAIFFGDVEKTLKPKVMFLQELGLSGPQLCRFISKNSKALTSSLDRTLKPSIFFIKEVLENDGSGRNTDEVNHDLFQILSRCIAIINNKSRVESNVLYLQTCGIVGSQLSKLLVRQPRVFALPNEKLAQIVARAVDMGFVMGSRMFVYGLSACTNRADTLNRKYDLFLSYGFSIHECSQMFLKAPSLLKTSDAKLSRGMEFFLHSLMLNKSALVRWPICLVVDMEKRVIPRCRIVEIIKSRKLLKREPSICSVLCLTNEKFVERYMRRFVDDFEELQAAYDGHLVNINRHGYEVKKFSCTVFSARS